VPGAKIVACAGGSKKCKGPKIAKSHGPVSWLARTDPVAKTIEFSDGFGDLTPEGKRYIAAHEQAHLLTGPDHDSRFYAALKKLIEQKRLDWKTAWVLESYNCGRKN
jgi:hypothetical protein